jgi:hypothetical protein
VWRLGVVIVWVLHRLGVIDRQAVWLLPAGVRSHLENADEVELFALDGATARPTAFIGAGALGSVVVSSPRTRRRLIRRVLLANRYSIGGMLCLGAEYGLRVRTGDVTLDLTFCFDCSKVWVSGPDAFHCTGTIAAFPVLLMNVVLDRAGIPRPPQTH